MTDGAILPMSYGSLTELPLQSRERETEACIVVSFGSNRPLPLSPLIKELQDAQKTRKFCITSQSRCDRSCESFIAKRLGYISPTEEDEDKSEDAKAIFKDAARIREFVEKGGQNLVELRLQSGHAPEAVREIISDCTLIIQTSALASSEWDKLRNATEKHMCELARSLHVHPWAKSVAGFGDKGLAIIVGETGDLSGYSSQEKVWNRLGLAVFFGKRQRKHADKVMAKIHGYSPRRRAEIWTLADSMFRHQWAGDKDEDGKDPKKTGKPVAIPAHAKGPYGEVYRRRRAQTADRGWDKTHSLNDARRIMTKALIADLWKAWNKEQYKCNALS